MFARCFDNIARLPIKYTHYITQWVGVWGLSPPFSTPVWTTVSLVFGHTGRAHSGGKLYARVCNFVCISSLPFEATALVFIARALNLTSLFIWSYGGPRFVCASWCRMHDALGRKGPRFFFESTVGTCIVADDAIDSGLWPLCHQA